MRTALIVDDNTDIRILLNQALELGGFEVLEAENGEVAQQKLENGVRPSIVLLDLMMPVMDGWQFLEWKNRQPQYADIPVVVISAMPKNKEMEGTKAYLKKPIDLNDMLDLVDAVTARKV